MNSQNVLGVRAPVRTTPPKLESLLPIVLASDAAYAMPLSTTLRSLAESNQGAWPLEIHVIHDGIDETTRSRISGSLPIGSVTSIHWHPVNLSGFAGNTALPHISKITFARLLLPDLFASINGCILYLDCDILVVGQLTELCTSDLDNAILGAVLDPLDIGIKSNKPGLEMVPRVGSYFNAGVLLIDLDRWRAEQVSQKALAYLDCYPNSPLADQDALNVACDKKWKALDRKWNFACGPEQDICSVSAEQRPLIFHFVTSAKPWIPSSLSVNAAYYDLVRSRTCFRRTPWESARDELERIAHQMLRRSGSLRAIWNFVKSSRMKRGLAAE